MIDLRNRRSYHGAPDGDRQLPVDRWGSHLLRPAYAPIEPALMDMDTKSSFVLSRKHLLGIEGLSYEEIVGLLDLAEEFVAVNRQIEKKRASLRGRTQINLFFEAST